MNKSFLYILLLMISTTVHAQNEIKQEIRKIIKYDTNLEYGKENGFQVAIIDEDTSFVFEFGVIDTSSISLFETGSVMKTLTASLVTSLINKSFFKLLDPVNNYLPSNFTNPRLDHLKIIDLLEHKSGFPKRPNDFGSKEIHIQNPYANYTKLDLLRFYRDFLETKDNYGKYLYAHTNYALLEIVIENATQESFEDLLYNYIFKPLNMNNSFVDLSEYVEEHIADAYDRSKTKVKPWTFESFAASNGLKTNIQDLLTFVNININTGIYDENHSKRLVSNFNKKIFGARGWHILTDEAPHDIVTISGKTSGHHCMITFIKETKTGVIVLSNNAKGSNNLAFLILRMINDNWKRQPNYKL